MAPGDGQHKQGPQSYNHSKCILARTVVSLEEEPEHEMKTQLAHLDFGFMRH